MSATATIENFNAPRPSVEEGDDRYTVWHTHSDPETVKKIIKSKDILALIKIAGQLKVDVEYFNKKVSYYETDIACAEDEQLLELVEKVLAFVKRDFLEEVAEIRWPKS